jgi:hypothetical protein
VIEPTYPSPEPSANRTLPGRRYPFTYYVRCRCGRHLNMIVEHSRRATSVLRMPLRWEGDQA